MCHPRDATQSHPPARRLYRFGRGRFSSRGCRRRSARWRRRCGGSVLLFTRFLPCHGWGDAEPDWLELSDWGSCAEAKDARKKTNASRNERMKTRLGKLSRDMEGELLTHNLGEIIL